MYWNWKLGALILGLTFLLAVVLMKPIGVSTEFVISDGLIAKTMHSDVVQKDETAASGYTSSNAYLASGGGSYAKSVANPMNYSYLFVVFMILGGFLGRWFSFKKSAVRQVPEVHENRYGNRPGLRYLLSFVGGAFVLYGARMAGGCTSGHMMSGMMQTSLSGFLFAAATFIVAVPISIWLYGKRD